MPESNIGVWLYAVVRGLTAERLSELAGGTGVGGTPVRAVESAGLVAVVASVSLDEFGEEPLRRNLEDLDWLAATARSHDALVDAVGDAGPAVPMRLATVYHDDEGVRRLLSQRRRDFETVLDRLDGRTEWGVKGFGDPTALATAPEQDDGPEGKGAGTAYLLRRKAQRSARDTGEREAAALAEHIHAELTRLAVADTRHAPQDPKLAGTQTRMILNGAYLVDNDRAEEFAQRVGALADERPALRLELTGPWPPYSFAGLEQGETP